MSCNSKIHDALKDMHELLFPFYEHLENVNNACDQQLKDYMCVEKEDNKELIDVDGTNVCKSCGIVDSFFSAWLYRFL